VGAKLAVGCLLALGVGAGCVVLTEKGALPRAPRLAHMLPGAAGSSAPAAKLRAASGPLTVPGLGVPARSDAPPRAASASAGVLTSAGRASREFGLERARATGGERPAAAGPGRQQAVAGSASGHARGATVPEASGSARAAATSPGGVSAPSPRTPAAQREFAPG
jgi:hypothetical protein